MPLITRRSSTRALPRVSVGRCGLIFENCAFVSQNWSRLIYASFSEAVNHAITFVPTLLWVRTLVRYCKKQRLLWLRKGYLWRIACSSPRAQAAERRGALLPSAGSATCPDIPSQA